MLPISVCELECDRPSKYGLGVGREGLPSGTRPHKAKLGLLAEQRPQKAPTELLHSYEVSLGP